MSEIPRPPYDPELKAALDVMPAMPTLTLDLLPLLRSDPSTSSPDAWIAGRPLEVSDHIVPMSDGAEIVVSVLRRIDHSATEAPGIFNIHGGGMVGGDRWVGADSLIRWVETYGAVAATVEYRLAPEFPDPVPLEDCYTALEWFASRGGEFGFDASRLMIVGASAGGGLAAGTVLLARDRRGPEIAAQVLMCAMLDDRDDTLSSRQYEGAAMWDRDANRFGWNCLLGDRAGTADVSVYTAPARATDLSGLPPAFLDVGSAEVFRDEVVAYATKIWEAGGQAELHVWNGGFHGYEMVPTAAISISTAQAREAWVRRYLGV